MPQEIIGVTVSLLGHTSPSLAFMLPRRRSDRSTGMWQGEFRVHPRRIGAGLLFLCSFPSGAGPSTGVCYFFSNYSG